jgi:hypothetical protein
MHEDMYSQAVSLLPVIMKDMGDLVEQKVCVCELLACCTHTIYVHTRSHTHAHTHKHTHTYTCAHVHM